MATSRNFKNISATTTPSKMAVTYSNMIYSVINMLNKEGPIYSTWIRFQVGKTNPILFDSTSNNKKENMIASLEFNKKGAGVVNDFTLSIKYDPFDYGQSTKDKIELLDELIATAMSYDMDSDTNRLRGYIQYGYNVPDDTTLVSPKYEFLLTNAESEIDWSTGIADYKFEGTTDLAADAEFTTSLPEFKDENLIEVVESVLWAYYGKKDEKPSKVLGGLTYVENNWNYKIEIDGNLKKTAPSISSSSTAKQSPWLFCKDLLETHMSTTDAELKVYEESDVTSQKPRYTIFITDEAGNKTIHIGYVAPKDSGANNVKIDYRFTWGKEGIPNIVVKWNPQTDLRLYLLQKAVKDRANAIYNANGGKDNVSQEFEDHMYDTYLRNSDVYEMYDATLTLIGIPADIPLAAEVEVMPRILESVSRTAGVYMIQNGIDRINTNGLFTSELKLLRIRDIDEAPVSRLKTETKSTRKNTSDVANSGASKDTNKTTDDTGKTEQTTIGTKRYGWTDPDTGWTWYWGDGTYV